MNIRKAGYEDEALAAPLIAAFRVALRALKGVQSSEDLDRAGDEFREYLGAGYPIFLCEIDRRAAGYMVLRVDFPVVWVESIFVREDCRRRGIAAALFEKAEELATANGEHTLYNYVHPNNDAMIAFLKKRGYDVLNLIEIRRRLPDEKLTAEIPVGDHVFLY